jgi:hypothetical protein
VFHPQVVEKSQGGASEVPQFRVVSLAFQFSDHNHGQDDVVLGEPPDRIWIGEKNAGVEDIRTAGPR